MCGVVCGQAHRLTERLQQICTAEGLSIEKQVGHGARA